MSRNSGWNRHTGWVKSSYSGGANNCVEVSRTADAVGIRDSKDAGTGDVLVVSRSMYRAFINATKAGAFAA